MLARSINLLASVLGPALWPWAVVVVLGAAPGCATWNLKGLLPGPDAPPKPQTPARMTDIWTDTILYQPGQPAVRGFGGRVMFYGEQDSKPIAVDGTFTVFAFDDTPTSPKTTSPEKKFVILPEQLPQHYSRSELGHSYSFWLPWDEVGGKERRICLICRFDPRKGKPVFSQPSHHVLPGSKAEAAASGGWEARAGAAQPAATQPVQQASYESLSRQAVAPPGTISTLTLDVPPSFARPMSPNTPPPPAEPQSLTHRLGQAGLSEGSAAESSGLLKQTQAAAAVPSALDCPAPSVRSAPRRFPARRGLAAPPGSDPVRRQPLPATWPSALPPTPRSGSRETSQAAPTSGESGFLPPPPPPAG